MRQRDGKELLCLNLYARYAKVDGKLYGVIKTAWRYKERDDFFRQYYDDAYVLYNMSAGTMTEISRDDLVTVVGARSVYMGEYGKGFEVPRSLHDNQKASAFALALLIYSHKNRFMK